MPKVFVTSKIRGFEINVLEKSGFGVDVNDSGRPVGSSKLKKIFSQYDAVLTSVADSIDDEVISHASSDLKIISNYAVGVDNIDVLAAKRKGIIVTNTPGVAGEAVAEHTFTLILACAKNLLEADKYVRQGKYSRWDAALFVSPALWGKTIGIIGLGKIGTYVGHIAYGGFKMNILYNDLIRAEDFEMLTEAKFSTLERIFKEADVVTLHVPLTPLTRHLIGKAELKAMKKSATLINTARGPVIDEKALVWALKEKEIAAVGLDVFEKEPQVSGELVTMSNVVLTPHIASATAESRDSMARMATQNIIDVFEGKEPFGVVKVT